VIDPGEDCDDGNLVSRDGCDSRCRLETASWQLVPISPNLVDARRTAYDPGSHHLVHAASDSSTWEWDGTRWTVTRVSASQAVTPLAVYYDPDRQQVAMVASDNTAVIHLYGWSGRTWTVIDSGAAPVFDDDSSIDGVVVAYDPTRHLLYAVGTHGHLLPFLPIIITPPSISRAWTVDATGTWTEIASVPTGLYDAVGAFDPVAAQPVLEDDGGDEWLFDGTAWTSSVSGFGPRLSLALDPTRGRLVAVDGATQTLYERIAAAWSAVPDSTVPCGTPSDYRPLYYDAASGAMALFTVDSSMVCTWNAAWTARVPALPFRPVGATYEPITHGLVVMNDARTRDPAAGVEPWQLTAGGWQRIATPHVLSGREGPLAVYSSGRAATIMYGGLIDGWTPETWGFDGTDWTQAAAPLASDPLDATYALTYDATHGRVLLMMSDTWWGLGDSDTAWQQLDLPAVDGAASAVAWDARNATLVAVGQLWAGSSPLIELTAQGWAGLELVPGDVGQTFPSVLMSDARSGGVLAFNLGTGAAWERIGPTWHRLPAIPLASVDSAWAAYNPSDGSVLYVGHNLTGQFAAVLTRTSPTALESCRPGEDLDGDGLAGCDDPDCFWACGQPPPYARR
jgi:cysteine-rich repeat protein